jgi:hypothetical protein
MKKESEVMNELNLSKAEIKALRESAPEGSWIRDVSKRPERLWGYLWSEVGVKYLTGTIDKPVTVTESPKVDTDTYECTVLRSGFTNKRLIEIEFNGKKIKAVCRDSSVIKPRCIVKVRIVGESACVLSITKKHMNSLYNG